MIETWGAVARLIVLVWAVVAVVPALIYVVRRAISRAEVAEKRDQGIITTSYERLPAAKPHVDDEIG